MHYQKETALPPVRLEEGTWRHSTRCTFSPPLYLRTLPTGLCLNWAMANSNEQGRSAASAAGRGEGVDGKGVPAVVTRAAGWRRGTQPCCETDRAVRTSWREDLLLEDLLGSVRTSWREDLS